MPCACSTSMNSSAERVEWSTVQTVKRVELRTTASSGSELALLYLLEELRALDVRVFIPRFRKRLVELRPVPCLRELGRLRGVLHDELLQLFLVNSSRLPT